MNTDIYKRHPNIRYNLVWEGKRAAINFDSNYVLSFIMGYLLLLFFAIFLMPYIFDEALLNGNVMSLSVFVLTAVGWSIFFFWRSN